MTFSCSSASSPSRRSDSWALTLAVGMPLQDATTSAMSASVTSSGPAVSEASSCEPACSSSCHSFSRTSTSRARSHSDSRPRTPDCPSSSRSFLRAAASAASAALAARPASAAVEPVPAATWACSLWRTCLTLAPASSITSMALSGSFRPDMYCAESLTAARKASGA